MITQKIVTGVKNILFRRELLKNDFFKNVRCDDKVTKNLILDWMFELKENKNITIKRFSYLFSKYEEIVFPITISLNSYAIDLEILDSLGNEYYLSALPFHGQSQEKYVIGKRKYPIDKCYEYQITCNKEILITKIAALQLKENGANKPESYTFIYDYDLNVTKATLEKEKYSVEVVYEIQDKQFDEGVLNYFLEVVNSNRRFKNITEIVIDIRNIRKIDFLCIKVVKNSEILTEIAIYEGLVKKYSIIDSKTRMLSSVNFISEKLEDFMLDFQKKGSPI